MAHLLALHGGRLELHSQAGEGTTAAIILPRGDALPAATAPAEVEAKRVRADIRTEPAKPHAIPEVASTLEPPEKEN